MSRRSATGRWPDDPRRRGRRRDAAGPRPRPRGSAATTSDEAADGRGALARWELRRPGPRPARPRPARHGRARSIVRRDPPRGDDADRDPVRPVRGAREGRGARARRRRLRHQAVRRRRAQRAAPRRPPPRGGPGRPTPTGRIAIGPLVLDVRRHEVRVERTSRVDLTPREFEILRVLLTQRGPRRHEGPAAARRLGRGLPGRGQLRLRPRQPAPPQARRGRPDGALRRPHRHRAGRRLPGVDAPDRPTTLDGP